MPTGETPPEKWLTQNLAAGAKFGYDPWLHTVDGAERLGRVCTDAGAVLTPADIAETGVKGPPTVRRFWWYTSSWPART